jgi:hypothetical protein
LPLLLDSPGETKFVQDETQILNRQDAKHANTVGRSLLRRPDVWAAVFADGHHTQPYRKLFFDAN